MSDGWEARMTWQVDVTWDPGVDHERSICFGKQFNSNVKSLVLALSDSTIA